MRNQADKMSISFWESKSPVRVVMLIWSYWPGHEGGAEIQCRKIIPYLLKQGVEVTVVTAQNSVQHAEQEFIDGYQVVRLGRWVSGMNRILRWIKFGIARFPMGITRAARIQAQRREAAIFWLGLPWTMLARVNFLLVFRRWLKHPDNQPSIIHVHETLWLSGAASAFAQSQNIPVLAKTATNPAWEPLGYDVPFRGYFSRKRKSCYFLALNSHLVGDLIQNGIPLNHIFQIPNGVIVPGSFNRTDESFNVLFVANFSQGVEEKAFDVLIHAWRSVVRSVPSARLLLLGDGDSSQWETLVESMSLQESVVFVGWTDDPASYYPQTSLFVLPSRVEGMSNALLEAQSYGLPCVVSDIPGNLAVVEDGVNGLVVPVGDEQDLAKALICLLLDPSLRETLGTKAHQIAASRFSMESVAERLVETYRLIADSRCENG